jgi:hypothetical protein
MAVDTQEQWLREFRKAGPDKVRADLVGARWEREKRSAAREWLDRRDAAAWAEANPEDAPRRSIKNTRFWIYAVMIFLIALGISRVFKKVL